MPCTGVGQKGIMKCKLGFNCNFMLGCSSFSYRRGGFLRVFDGCPHESNFHMHFLARHHRNELDFAQKQVDYSFEISFKSD